MSNANDAFFSRNPSLLTLKGEVSVHFLDGNVMEGEFATQDALNIFLTVEGQPVMIPRHQIRYIKGNQGQQIEADTSQAALFEAKPIPAPSPDSDRDTTDEYEVEGFDDDDDDDDGTVVLGPEDVIFPDDDDDDDDGTVVLPAGISELIDEEEDEDDGTVILPAPAATEPGFEADDVTLVPDDAGHIGLSASLVCIGGPHTGQTFKIEGETTSIGRSSDNGVVLSGDKEISRHHAIISWTGDNFSVRDNDSLNGTFVNDERVTAPRSLKNNDVVVVGISALKYQEE